MVVPGVSSGSPTSVSSDSESYLGSLQTAGLPAELQNVRQSSLCWVLYKKGSYYSGLDIQLLHFLKLPECS